MLQSRSPPNSAALSWGMENEEVTRREYDLVSRGKHSSLQIKATGLHVSPKYPHLGASPDGLLTCTCCGDGLLEIKCPYSLRHTTLNSAGKDFYLKRTPDGLKLSTSHACYYQVQGQLEICDRLYGDFVCWTPNSIHIERIYRNTDFWGEMKPKLEAFFLRVILPCVLVGQVDKENTSPTTDESVFCYCCKGEKGDMIACDNPACDYEWFHFSCVGLKSEPQGTWFCPDCQI